MLKIITVARDILSQNDMIMKRMLEKYPHLESVCSMLLSSRPDWRYVLDQGPDSVALDPDEGFDTTIDLVTSKEYLAYHGFDGEGERRLRYEIFVGMGDADGAEAVTGGVGGREV